MAVYEKRDDVYCGSCGRFTRHYIWYVPPCSPGAGRFMPLGVGHCAYPRIKDRREGQSCPLWVPRTPGQDPPDVRLPGKNAHERCMRGRGACCFPFFTFPSAKPILCFMRLNFCAGGTPCFGVSKRLEFLPAFA